MAIAFKTLLNRDADVVVPSADENRSGVSQSSSKDPKLQVFKTEVVNRSWSRQKHRRDTLMYVSRFVSFRDFGVVTLDKIM